jgi:murein DD-endopeptidase MepM/ murein hydrolase activator NlpD
LPHDDQVAPEQADRWIWPVQGEISQFYTQGHRAIDIVSAQGALVVAADEGEVVYAKWESSGFGYLVIVDHGDGHQTYYGHLYGFYADVGQRVERGDLLGQLGNTGNSTGPHLHFEIRRLGLSRDPLKLLPPQD